MEIQIWRYESIIIEQDYDGVNSERKHKQKSNTLVLVRTTLSELCVALPNVAVASEQETEMQAAFMSHRYQNIVMGWKKCRADGNASFGK